MLFARWAPIDVSPELYAGFIYLCILPATVQSAIAFTSLAGGNVAAAVCSASASSLLGIFVSPLLVGLLMNVHGDTGSLRQVGSIVLQLLVPFVAGHLLRPLIGGWIERHRPLIGKTDQTSILLVVYAAFSEAVTHGIWHQVGIGSLAFIVGGSIVLLAIVLVVNTCMARWLGFSKADEITIVFCGSKKSGERHSNGQYPVPGGDGGDHGAAANGVPSGAADDLCGAGEKVSAQAAGATGGAQRQRAGVARVKKTGQSLMLVS